MTANSEPESEKKMNETDEEEQGGIFVEDLPERYFRRFLERYFRRFHEGPVLHGPATVQLSCQTCHASVIFDPGLWGVMMVDFPPQVSIPEPTS